MFKRIFRNIYRYQNSIQFIGSIEEFKVLTKESNDNLFSIKWTSATDFRLTKFMSFGTILIRPRTIGLKFGSIYLLGNINKDQINLTSEFRIEYVFYTLVSIFFIGVGLFTHIAISIFGFMIWPVLLLWFSFWYRSQEKELYYELKKLIYQHHLRTGKIKIDNKGRK